MKFKNVLPAGCIVEAGGIPIRLITSAECESETPIKIDLISGIEGVAVADEQSIDDINNNPNNIYYNKSYQKRNQKIIDISGSI